MNKLIHSPAFDIFIDKENDRFFLVGRRVNVFDASTNKKLASLGDIPNKLQVYVSNRHNLIVVSSTVGHFAFYSSTDYSLLGTLKIRNRHGSNDYFYYDEDENAIYGVCNSWKNNRLFYFVYRVSPETMSYTTYNLPTSLDPPNEPEFPIMYFFHKHVGDDFFLRRNNCDEILYGRYRIENGVMALKEAVFTQNRNIEKYDLEDRVCNEEIHEFIRLQFYSGDCGYFTDRIFRNDRGLFLVFINAVFRFTNDGEFEKVYTDNYMSDYAEYNGRQYICTWEHCLVRDIEKQNNG